MLSRNRICGSYWISVSFSWPTSLKPPFGSRSNTAIGEPIGRPGTGHSEMPRLGGFASVRANASAPSKQKWEWRNIGRGCAVPTEAAEKPNYQEPPLSTPVDEMPIGIFD